VFQSHGYQGSLPEDMPAQQLTYEWFAENYHFTEEMTGSLSLDALTWWPVIRAARNNAARAEQDAQQRLHQAVPKVMGR
jgi:CHASE1-domain containing sensor protein